VIVLKSKDKDFGGSLSKLRGEIIEKEGIVNLLSFVIGH
jgi:hypothetical protein